MHLFLKTIFFIVDLLIVGFDQLIEIYSWNLINPFTM